MKKLKYVCTFSLSKLYPNVYNFISDKTYANKLLNYKSLENFGVLMFSVFYILGVLMVHPFTAAIFTSEVSF
jgi:hypothetical protein